MIIKLLSYAMQKSVESDVRKDVEKYFQGEIGRMYSIVLSENNR